jgi:hypothetical protein
MQNTIYESSNIYRKVFPLLMILQQKGAATCTNDFFEQNGPNRSHYKMQFSITENNVATSIESLSRFHKVGEVGDPWN